MGGKSGWGSPSPRRRLGAAVTAAAVVRGSFKLWSGLARREELFVPSPVLALLILDGAFEAQRGCPRSNPPANRHCPSGRRNTHHPVANVHSPAIHFDVPHF